MSVYFIRDTGTGLIKIGHGANPRRRLQMLQTGCPTRLELMAVIEGGEADERSLHQRFHHLREQGEWFRQGGDLLDHIGTLPAVPVYKRPSKAARTWNGFTTVEVSAATGISEPMLSMIRTGKRRPSPEAALAIQRATGVSAIKLVFGEFAEEAA
jgi:hypothetical protein